ncbi:class I SAM-dependent methyltransferase [Amnibacterium kyonggiense]|uniref:Methyltransferase family protein n=1 Tax=Amnibacterium kyonggiense TaxID=595671 RepID=A0A4R7FQ97_9MICO|nr:class I SAM-dependent methyltransferase [Amnibacterium kyonggiense]TDS79769.1 methyltransferase family protein [Amnibacterium kyonggiense]
MSSRSRDFWEGRYRTAAEAGTSLWGDAPNGWIAERVAGLAPGVAVDIGAGEGRNALALARRGWRVIATDFSPAAVEGMRAAGAGLPLEAVEADATTWTAPEPADLAVLCYLQLRPEGLAAAIARAAESLAPGGVLLGIWHDREDVERGLAGTMDPAIRTTPDETRAAAEAAGLVVELSGRRDRETAAGLACDCLLIARRPVDHTG